jgi:hypothetical protein
MIYGINNIRKTCEVRRKTRSNLCDVQVYKEETKVRKVKTRRNKDA